MQYISLPLAQQNHIIPFAQALLDKCLSANINSNTLIQHELTHDSITDPVYKHVVLHLINAHLHECIDDRWMDHAIPTSEQLDRIPPLMNELKEQFDFQQLSTPQKIRAWFKKRWSTLINKKFSIKIAKKITIPLSYASILIVPLLGFTSILLINAFIQHIHQINYHPKVVAGVLTFLAITSLIGILSSIIHHSLSKQTTSQTSLKITMETTFRHAQQHAKALINKTKDNYNKVKNWCKKRKNKLILASLSAGLALCIGLSIMGPTLIIHRYNMTPHTLTLSDICLMLLTILSSITALCLLFEFIPRHCVKMRIDQRSTIKVTSPVIVQGWVVAAPENRAKERNATVAEEPSESHSTPPTTPAI